MTSAKSKIQSPVFKHFCDMKKKHPNAFLLFRCGNFYETYNEDAEETSKILGITLTTSRKYMDITGMASFPCHALDTYLAKLIRAGKRVAILDGISEPNIINPQNNNNNMESTENKKQIEGIAVETLKALNGTLPTSLNKRFSDALGTLNFINLKYTNNAKIFPDEMAYLIKYAEIGLKAENK